MNLEFYIDPVKDEPHIYGHGVDEDECEQVLEGAAEVRPGEGGLHLATGRTNTGRLLRVVFRKIDEGGTLFVVTAFEPGRKTAHGWRRRRRKKR